MLVLPQQRFVASPLLLITAALCAGIAIGHYSKLADSRALTLLIGLTAILALATTALLFARKLLASTLMMLAAFFCTGVAVALIANQPFASNRIARMLNVGVVSTGDPVELTGVVIGEPEPAPQSFYLTVKAQRINFKGIERESSGTILLLARIPNQELVAEYEALALHHGARIRVMTALAREDDFRNPGVMPFTEYLEREGFDATGTIKSPLLMERLGDEAVFVPLAWVYSWRARLQREFSKTFSSETSGVLNAALLGNPHNISAGAAERFRAGGTFHILVISGLQIAFIAGVVFLIVRRITRRRVLQFLLATMFLWAYTIAVGAQPSVARAALMFTIAAFAPIVARQSNSLNTIAGAALALLIWNASNLFDPSFQLTFLSVLAIVCLAVPLLRNMQRVGSWRPMMVTPYPPACSPWFRKLSEILYWSERDWKAEMAASNISYRLYKAPLAERLERWRIQRALRFAVAAVVISASVQLVLLPAMVLYFHRVSIASLVLNIFVGFLMVVLAFAALAAVLVAHISATLAWPLVFAAEKVNWLMIHLVDPLSRAGLASFRLPHYQGAAGAIYLAYFLFVGGLLLAFRRWDPLQPNFRTTRRTLLQRPASVLAALVAITLAAIVFHPFSATAADGKLHIDFLDVGQGDCAVVTTPEGTTILIDGGGQPSINWKTTAGDDEEEPFQRDTRSMGERVVSEYLWSRGFDTVDYVIATHADADHIDGLNDIMRNFKVRSAIVARAPHDDPEFRRFAQTARDTGVLIETISSGDVMRVGSVALEVLWPPPTRDADAPSGNNDSIAVRIRLGNRSFLFTGDIEKDAEAAMLNAGADLRSDTVKVPHHGSRTSSTSAFITATGAPLAIISVGRTSIFGHPNKEVVERWRASGAQVMTTGEKGTISVVTDGSAITVTTYVR
jgi:competence protein ComEC